jgi:subtilisin family serine protease
MNRPHLYLKNNIEVVEKFPKRGFPPEEDKNENDDPYKYEPKKRIFSSCLSSFNNDIQIRYANRIKEVSKHIDYVKIYFHGVFNKDLSSKYLNCYGLVPVKYEEFNHTVLFGISDESKLGKFKEHIETFANRKEGDSELNEDSYLLVHIDQFELLKSSEILKGFINESAIIELIDNTELFNSINAITTELITYLNEIKKADPNFVFSIESNHKYIDIKNAPNDLLKSLADNYDVIYKIQSHTFKVKPNKYGVREISEDFQIQPNNEAPLVGIIDSGVQQNSVLKDVISNFNYDVTNPENPLPILDMNGHGTSIAGLVALGTDFFDISKSIYQAQANIVPIKVLEGDEGTYSMSLLEEIIRDAASRGVKLFNISMTSTVSKFYNESVSEFAYLLDKLSYELDVLFFLAAGNLGYEDMEEIQKVNIPFHKYPNHFYNPEIESNEHVCECSNINSPAESYNNLTIGAIAENYNSNDSDLTYSKILPAYYSKKYHLDFSKKLNGYHVTRSVINKNIHKPDVVFAGGDAINNSSGMEVISTKPGLLTEFSYGTSNATPLVTNIAANIKSYYPNLNAQSIKALIINSSSVAYTSNFLKPLIEDLKTNYAKQNYGGRSLGNLTIKEKTHLSKLYNRERLFSYLVGHGIPKLDNAVYSTDNSVTVVLENTVKVNSHKGLIIKLPNYLEKLSTKSNQHVINISATLCYSFFPC